MPSDTTFLEQIRQTEYEQLDRFTRFTSNMKMVCTRNLVGREVHVKRVTQKMYRPSVFLQLGLLAFIAGLLYVSIISWNRGEKNTWVGVGLAFLFLLGYIYQFHVDKSANYTIILDVEGINIKGVQYNWPDIDTTAILSIGGRSKNYFLILGMNNQHTYEKFALNNFFSFHPNGFAYSLAEYIEYFKPKKVQDLTD